MKIVATRCQILRLKCTKFEFGWGCTTDPVSGAYRAPSDPLVGEEVGCPTPKTHSLSVLQASVLGPSGLNTSSPAITISPGSRDARINTENKRNRNETKHALKHK